MAANTNNNTVKYKFQDQADLLFYILNAAGHDFIHDFNNYGRMGKILNYIMGLVEHANFDQETTTRVTDVLSQTAEELRAQPPDTEETTPEPEGQISEEEKESPPEYEEESPTGVPPTGVPPTGVPPTGVPPTNNQEIIIEPNGESETGNPVDDSTQILSTYELEISQAEENFFSEQIQPIIIADASSDNTIQDIINRNIASFNYLSTSIDPTRMETRSITKKINILQRLKDFIQEGKFLIISKLRDVSSYMEVIDGGAKRIKKQKGGNGINVITKNNIVQSIKDIIEEIKEATPQNLQLISFFEYVMFSYLNLSIPGISPLETFNNSLIEDSASIFIVGQCNNTNIREQAKLCLRALLSSSSTKQNIASENVSLVKAKGLLNPMAKSPLKPMAKGLLNSFARNRVNPMISSISRTMPTIQAAGNKIFVGGAFGGKTFSDIPQDIWYRFEASIETFKGGRLYQTYKDGELFRNLGEYQGFYREYETFIGEINAIVGVQNLMELIVGKQMLRVKTTIINNKLSAIAKGGRNIEKNIQEMVDTIIDLIIVKTIDVYEDIKNRQQASSEDSGDGSTIKGSAKTAVQRVSRLLATEILKLTGAQNLPTTNSDLKAQIEILDNIATKNRGYSSVDDVLIEHFIRSYAHPSTNILSGFEALAQLDTQLTSCKPMTCRVINNAVPSETKSKITKIVVCPTSSVCDGMGSFGSCVNPKGNKEYANMNFSVTFGDNESNYYYGQTNIKPDLTSVNINYGIKYNNLEIYNFIDIRIDSQPIILQANYVFKNLINRIIEIWKGIQASNIEDLWGHLYETDYFLSILKLGSQKAVGDIFQEINSTLINGGYNIPVTGLNTKNTYGLMGDRPSGVRVFKLLTGSPEGQGKNPRASGGYVGGDTSFIYFSQVVGTAKKPSTGGPVRGTANRTSRQTLTEPYTSTKKTGAKRGGNKITRKRKHKITHKYYKRRTNKTIKIKK